MLPFKGFQNTGRRQQLKAKTITLQIQDEVDSKELEGLRYMKRMPK